MTEICPHKSLRRQCDLCDAYAEIDRLNQVITSQSKKLEVMTEAIRRIEGYNMNSDHNLIAAVCEDILRPKIVVLSTLTEEGEGDGREL